MKKTSKKKIDISVFFKKILLCAIAIYICVSLISQQFDLAKLDAEEKLIDEQIELTKKEAKQLEDEKSLIGTDEYIERVARERLGYMKKYEKVFIDANK